MRTDADPALLCVMYGRLYWLLQGCGFLLVFLVPHSGGRDGGGVRGRRSEVRVLMYVPYFCCCCRFSVSFLRGPWTDETARGLLKSSVHVEECGPNIRDSLCGAGIVVPLLDPAVGVALVSGGGSALDGVESVRLESALIVVIRAFLLPSTAHVASGIEPPTCLSWPSSRYLWYSRGT